MKKFYKFKRTLSAVLLLMMSSLTWAYDFEVDGIYYNNLQITGTVEVTYKNISYSTYSGDVVIPSSVTYNDKTYSVTSIGDWAFSDCHSLTSISIPEGVTSIGDEAFVGCSSLASIKVAANNPVYDSREGCNAIIETSSNTLILGCQNTIIPESVTSIGTGAFYGCTSLTSISIPKSVTSIGNFAFYDCTSLTSISIPEGVTSIGNYAFYDCSSLTSISIPEGVTSIGNYAFYDCSSLTSISIPESVMSIGDYAFEFCSSLTSISIPEGVTSIGHCAFADCSSLTSIPIPEGVTSIGNYAFEGCSSLTSVICHAEQVPELGFNVFTNVPTSEATLYVPASSLEDYKAADQWKEFGTILPLEDIPAGISFIEADEINTPYYTLDGIKVDNPTHKSIYIRNGKKTLIK